MRIHHLSILILFLFTYFNYTIEARAGLPDITGEDASNSPLTPPVIDIHSLFHSPTTDKDFTQRKYTIKKIGRAVKKWGFFYVINHSISLELISDFINITEKFFQESTPDQLNNIRRTQNNSRGYTDSEFTKQKIDLKRVFDVSHKLYPDLDDDHPDNTGFEGHNQWPHGAEFHSQFRRILETYYLECEKVSKTLMNALLIHLYGLNRNDNDDDDDDDDDRVYSKIDMNDQRSNNSLTLESYFSSIAINNNNKNHKNHNNNNSNDDKEHLLDTTTTTINDNNTTSYQSMMDSFVNHTSFLRLNYYPPTIIGIDQAALDNTSIISSTSTTNPNTCINNSNNSSNSQNSGSGSSNSNNSTHSNLGVSRHTDAGLLTVLLQGDVPGLEVYTGSKQEFSDGEWVAVDPVPGALTINVGDMLQVLSNGRFKAAEHRVRATQAEAEAARYSAPFFFNPAYNTLITPILNPHVKKTIMNHTCDDNSSNNDDNNNNDDSKDTVCRNDDYHNNNNNNSNNTNNSTKNTVNSTDVTNKPKYRGILWLDFRMARFNGDYSDKGREIQIEDFLIG